MHSVRNPRRRQVALVVWLLGFLIAMGPVPAAAFDLFADHSVDVQFATQTGKPMADAEVAVFPPGDPDRPVAMGRTDKNGKFHFDADRDGLWTAEAHTSTEIARATVRVGGATTPQTRLPPAVLLGGLGVLLAIAVAYRFLRARARRH